MPTTETKGVVLHYELGGNEQGEVLVLANSLGSNLHMWDKVARTFQSTFRVLRFDTRGHRILSSLVNTIRQHRRMMGWHFTKYC